MKQSLSKKESASSPKFKDLAKNILSSHNIEVSESNGDDTTAMLYQPSKLTFSNLPLTSSPDEDQSNYGNKLQLTGELFFNKEIIITKQGMINGLRKKNDGQTFFGLFNTKDYTGRFYNDLVINYNFKSRNTSSTGRVFDISFQKKTNDYKLYMIHNSLVLYYQIDNLFYLENNREYYIILGKILATVVTRKNETKKVIDINIEEDNEEEVCYTFTEDDSPISIGRVGCDVEIQNGSISKKHAEIGFSSENSVFYFKDLGSTNGSMAIIKEDDTLKLKGDMKFKMDEIPFRILELP